MFAALQGRFRLVAIDLPGFGSAADVDGYNIAAMADYVTAKIRRLAPERWVLVGHSMGAKVACAIARQAEDGADGLERLTHVVLVAGSPPRPEPMADEKRQTMRAWFVGSEEERRREADVFIRDNVAGALSDQDHAAAIHSVLSANRNAWIAWLDSGSREDWRDRIGTLHTPALILAGERDAALGMSAQQTAMAPHFADLRWQTIPDTGHLLPLERPETVAASISTFVLQPEMQEPAIPTAYRALIGSHRVSAKTRDVLLARAEPVLEREGVLTRDETATLRSLTDRLVPQRDRPKIDIAGRLLDMVARGGGDGWRFAELPSDRSALVGGLRQLDALASALDGANFAALCPDRQDMLLAGLLAGSAAALKWPGDAGLTPRQMTLWFEDMRSLATQIYVSHPATQARIGFSGVANRGDGEGPQGFQHVGLGECEAWEPGRQTGVDR